MEAIEGSGENQEVSPQAGTSSAHSDGPSTTSSGSNHNNDGARQEENEEAADITVTVNNGSTHDIGSAVIPSAAKESDNEGAIRAEVDDNQRVVDASEDADDHGKEDDANTKPSKDNNVVEHDGESEKENLNDSYGDANDHQGDGKNSDENDNDEDNIDNDQNDDDEEDDEDNSDDGNDDEDDNQDDEDNDDDNSNNDDDDDDDGDNDSDGTDESGKDGSNPGLSDYERLRLERIKRNQEYLSQLGLNSNPTKSKPSARRKRKRQSDQSEEVQQRSSLSRRTKKDINYNDMPTRWIALSPAEQEKKMKARKERMEKAAKAKPSKVDRRMDKVVSTEFKRMKSQRKNNLKQAKRDLRATEREVKFWSKERYNFEKAEKRRLEYNRSLRILQEERKLLGGQTKMDIITEVEMRSRELNQIVIMHDTHLKSLEQRLQEQEEKRELERKVQMLDALDRFPRAMKEACASLNTILLERSPKAPPLPRRSKRTSTPTDVSNNDGEAEPSESSQNDTWHGGATELGANDMLLMTSTNSQLNSQADEKPESVANQQNGKRKPKKRELTGRNVGGWVSPKFADSIDRSWLEQIQEDATMDMKSFVPQIGDIVLYYPSGHRAFLEKHPDVLGNKTRNQLRAPLWIKAKREAARLKKASKQDGTSKPKNIKKDKDVGGNDENHAENSWWNEEWLNGAESGLWDFPIICRVERTHTEFPPDPDIENKVVDTAEGEVTITWSENQKSISSKRKQKDHKELPVIRLAVALKALTSLLPPVQENSAGTTDLTLPPNFAVVTAPQKDAQPFLIPFAWAYCKAHSLCANDDVILEENGNMKAKVEGFRSLGIKYGPLGLHDKTAHIDNLVDGYKQYPDSPHEAIERLLSQRDGEREKASTQLPFPEAYTIIKFLSNAIQRAANTKGATENVAPSTHMNFMQLIHSTLPILNGVNIVRGDNHRKVVRLSAWNLKLSKSRNPPVDKIFTSTLTKDWLPQRFEDSVRIKIEVTIDDFIKRNDDADTFVPSITEEIAPGYGCAVPVMMSFERLQKRLSVKKRARCYYRSTEAMLSDVQAISDNCVLYNSPESDLVLAVLELIPSLKKSISRVLADHIRERQSRLKENRERRGLFPATTAVSSESKPQSLKPSSAVGSGSSATQDNDTRILEGLYSPFRDVMDRSKLFSIYCDGHPASVSNDEGHAKPSTPPMWTPQAGDSVSYSRFFHSKFIEHHCESLGDKHCNLPSIVNQHAATERESLDSNSEPDWLTGKIVWVQYCFPRPEHDDEDESFPETLPIFYIGIRFENTAADSKIFGISWRPCHVDIGATDGGTSTSRDDSVKNCEKCQVPMNTSFLKPSWVQTECLKGPDVKINQESVRQSITLSAEMVKSIEKCLEFLKKRIVSGEAPDFVDPKLCVESVKRGFTPSARRFNSKQVPAFEELSYSVTSQSHTAPAVMPTRNNRNTRNAEVTEQVQRLAAVHFLPPWFSLENENAKASDGRESFPGSVLPFENLCLEFIFLRLQNGFYRHLSGLQNDILEAYVTSIFYITSASSPLKRKTVSMRRIARYLSSSRKNTGLTSETMGSVKKTIKEASNHRKRGPTNDVGVNEPQADKKVNKLKSGGRTDISTSKPSALSVEEIELMNRILTIRSLYATALVCTSETNHVELIFGLKSQHNSKMESAASPKLNPSQMSALKTIKTLLSAVGRESFLNRFRSGGQMKIKICCGGEVVPGERLVPCIQPMVLPVPPNLNNTTAPLRTRLEDSIVLGWNECFNNDDLTRCLFGRPGRMNSCVRCDARKRPLLECRVQKSHSNIDFDLGKVFAGGRGVNGLIQSLVQTENEVGTTSVGNAVKSHVATVPVSNVSGSLGTDSKATATIVKIDYPTVSNQGGNTNSTTLCPRPPQNDSKVGSGNRVEKINPLSMFEKATKAMKTAVKALNLAEKEVHEKARLTWKFIKSYFPVDPSDGHYTYCIICGLSGDVLCCDGCANVVHTHCIGLPNIPTDDWFCQICESKKQPPSTNTPSSKDGKKSGPPVDHAKQEDTVKQIAVAHNSLGETSTAAQTSGVKNEGPPKDLDHKGLDEKLSSESTPAPITKMSDEHPQTPSANTQQNEIESNANNATATRASAPNGGYQARNGGLSDYPTHESEIESYLHEVSVLLEQLQGSRETQKQLQGSRETQKQSVTLITPTAVTPTKLHQSGMASTTEAKTEGAAQKMEVNEGRKTDSLQECKYTVGSTFSKEFESIGFLNARVIGVPNESRPYYAVQFEDGDEEDMSESEITLCESLKPKKRGRGRGRSRPRKMQPQIASLSVPVSKQVKPIAKQRDEDMPEAEIIQSESPTQKKRGRGRPRKIQPQTAVPTSKPTKPIAKQRDEEMPEAEIIQSESPTKKRGRGRPRKIQPHTALRTAPVSKPAEQTAKQRGGGDQRTRANRSPERSSTSITELNSAKNTDRKRKLPETLASPAAGEGTARPTRSRRSTRRYDS